MRIQGSGQSQSSSNEPIVISGGNGDDRIHVTNNSSGGVDVTVTNSSGDSRSYSLTAEETERLVIQGRKGNDKIIIDPDVEQEIRIRDGRNRQNSGDAGSTDIAVWDIRENRGV